MSCSSAHTLDNFYLCKAELKVWMYLGVGMDVLTKGILQAQQGLREAKRTGVAR